MSTTKKRQLEEDYDENEQINHDLKVCLVSYLSKLHIHQDSHPQKPRTLPFRTSPASKHSHLFSDAPRWTISNPPTITPADSDNDEPIAAYPSSSPPTRNQCSSDPSSVHFSSSLVPSSLEDQDMTDSPPRQTWASATTILSGQRLTPPETTHLSPHTTNPANAGRVPTPVYGHFNIVPLPTGGSDVSMESDTEDFISIANSSPQQRWDMENKRRRRRLPSPISEDDDTLQSPTAVAGSMFGRMDVGEAHEGAEGEEEDVKHSKVGDEKDKGVWKQGGSRGEGFGKTTLSMGYRADCEKCRNRVAGHYSHVLRT
ncbi:MAG: hypothetical protein M1835_003637 [Candelina submexicana]|nr:MAG: hypothetical protein M1835_003637 [Candelina submexicana]